jgi:hypothetical protein
MTALARNVAHLHLVPKDIESKASERPWVKVRLSPGCLDVDSKIKDWTASHKAAGKLAMAVRLLEALDAGDLGLAAEIHPVIASLVQAGQKPRKSKPASPKAFSSESIDSVGSDSKNQESEGDAVEQLAIKLSAITGTDLVVNDRQVRGLAFKLHAAGYTPPDLDRLLIEVWRTDWRYTQRGDQQPSLEEVRKLIGRVKALPPLPPQPATAAPLSPDPDLRVDPPSDAGQAADPVQDDSPAANLPAIVPLSTSITVQRDPAEYQFLAFAINAATGCDLLVNPDQVGDLNTLFDAGYRHQHVVYFLDHIWPNVWPGSEGKPPTVKTLRLHIGQAKQMLNTIPEGKKGSEIERRIALLQDAIDGKVQLNDMEDLLPAWTGAADMNPYLDHPLYRANAEAQWSDAKQQDRQALAEWDRLNCSACHRPREVCKCASVAALPVRIVDSWLFVLGQTKLQLNKSTFQTWLSSADLVAYDTATCHLLVEVPSRYHQEWLNRHLLPSLTTAFNDFYRGGTSVNDHSPILIEIQIRPEVIEP